MNETEHTDHIRIHVDREPYYSPDPTTGAALYALGGVPEHHDLFREVSGDGEDELIERHARDVRLKLDEHFYSQKVFTIIVDTEAKEVAKNRLTFDDVVKLAFETPPSGPDILITVDYGMGPPENPHGSLRKGQSVRIKNGMVFDVSATDRS
ncbi:multiubiquitin domain-containing protein [Methylocapsa sp. D3K7]|uniref:multiubiquitin domain-containing protein n=1 Tax=Methylocapsa sp. D3K7 TaxID=3041435 RepID=UPI00244ECAEA|nr:multiubiquitin domain-containing protein [Methylocapsa sp. D3K7]WGJ15969.1 multiubiquitin domain-containing protein [Methylocapsa sp. D3K7]